jgi:hypothetical protein
MRKFITQMGFEETHDPDDPLTLLVTKHLDQQGSLKKPFPNHSYYYQTLTISEVSPSLGVRVKSSGGPEGKPGP